MNPSEFLDVLESLRTRLNARLAVPTLGKGEQLNVRSVVGAWFSEYQPSFVRIVGDDEQIRAMDEMMQDLLQLTSKDSARRTVLRAVSATTKHFRDKVLVPVSRAYWSRAPQRSPAGRDEDVANRLKQLSNELADGYEQAVIDIEDSERLSYRGPAAELREVLTQVLHTLAPDAEVQATEGYKEARRSGARTETTPTRAERTRFILRSRTKGSAITESAESYVVMVEERLGHVINTTFTRNNAATHAGQSKMRLSSCCLTLMPS